MLYDVNKIGAHVFITGMEAAGLDLTLSYVGLHSL